MPSTVQDDRVPEEGVPRAPPLTKRSPDAEGKVTVKVEFVFGDSTVTAPVPDAFHWTITLDIFYPHKTT